jgi:hypothetical protein
MRSQVGSTVQQFVPMNAIRAELRRWSLLERCATLGAATGGVIGAIGGLIIGLDANPATAWFAVLELGIPAGIAGGLVGCIAALIAAAVHRIKRSTMPSA